MQKSIWLKVSIVSLSIFLLTSTSEGQRRQSQKTPAKTTEKSGPVSVQTAVTKDGRTVLLKSDGTWEYTSDPIIPTKQVSQDSGAARAIKVLRVMAGATEVGINFTEYGRRLVDLKAEVDDALLATPDGDLKDSIRLALSAYADAGQAWNRLIEKGGTRYSEPSFYPDKDTWADDLQKKYDIPTSTLDPGAGMSEELRRITKPEMRKPFRSMGQTDVLNTIWKAARAFLEKAEQLQK